MDFILEMGFDVEKGKMGEFQEWLATNEKEVADLAPEGTAYIGTYVTIHTSEKQSGQVRSLWRLDSYGAQDRLAAAGKGSGRFRDLALEFSAFIDEDSDNWSNTLMKAVVDATLYESD